MTTRLREQGTHFLPFNRGSHPGEVQCGAGKVRQVIDSITSKVVLILGRFTPERKAILDAIRGALRTRDYVPIL